MLEILAVYIFMVVVLDRLEIAVIVYRRQQGNRSSSLRQLLRPILLQLSFRLNSCALVALNDALIGHDSLYCPILIAKVRVAEHGNFPLTSLSLMLRLIDDILVALIKITAAVFDAQ